ncbi:MAG: hypothetical protein WCY19_03580 [Candidatus Gastranaerophilaceae bacterium]
MNLNIFDMPINLNRYGRNVILDKAIKKGDCIRPDMFSVEKLQKDLLRIRVSNEIDKQPALESAFNDFVKNWTNYDTKILEPTLEALRNPKRFLEFIIAKVTKNNKSKYILKKADFVFEDRAKSADPDDVSGLFQDIVNVYIHNQNAVKRQQLGDNTYVKNLLKPILARLKEEQRLEGAFGGLDKQG